MRTISGLIKLAVAAIIIVFAIQNTEAVKVTYFFGRPPIELPLFIVVLAALLFGVLLSGMLYSMDRFRLKRNISGLKKHITKQDDELIRLRNIPFEEPKNLAKKGEI
jgi:uncharacterized integral membrane protein